MRNVRPYAAQPVMLCPAIERTWNYLEFNSDQPALLCISRRWIEERRWHYPHEAKLCPEFAISYIAAHKIYDVCCPVNYRLSCGELSSLLDDTKPAILIFDETYRALALEAVKHLKNKPRKLIVVGGTSDDVAVSYDDYVGNSTDEEPAFTCDYNIYD